MSRAVPGRDRRHDRRARGLLDPRDLPRGGGGAIPPARGRGARGPQAEVRRDHRDRRRTAVPRGPDGALARAGNRGVARRGRARVARAREPHRKPAHARRTVDRGDRRAVSGAPALLSAVAHCDRHDGAMGTLLYARGVSLDACFDVLNLNTPRLIQSIHADYIAAGADCIETNTFGANRFKLAVHGLDGQVREINRRGVALARDVRESSGRDVLVLGSIGPLGKYLAPLGTVTADDARAAFREQAEALLEGGVDAFVVETFSDLEEVALAVMAIRSVTDVPIVAQMAFTDDGVTFTGRPAAEVARTLRALPLQALGANCSVGSSTLYEVLEQLHAEADGLPLAIQPNAGLPSRIGERLIYLSSPAYMAEYAERMVDADARLVGGCCGTTPQHIAAMRDVLDRKRPIQPGTRRAAVTVRPVTASAFPGFTSPVPPPCSDA